MALVGTVLGWILHELMQQLATRTGLQLGHGLACHVINHCEPMMTIKMFRFCLEVGGNLVRLFSGEVPKL